MPLKPHHFDKSNELLVMVGIILLAICNGGCAGNRIEYDLPDPNLVGKIIHFKIPVAYIVFTNKNDAEEFGFDYPRINGQKVVRQIDSKAMADNPNDFLSQFTIDHIKDGMPFKILATYWVRHDWITREFAHDFQDAILQDNDGVLSVCSILFIKNESDFPGFKPDTLRRKLK